MTSIDNLLEELYDKLTAIDNAVMMRSINNSDEEGSWITINGSHILIKPGENVGQAFERTYGQKMQPGENVGQAFNRVNGINTPDSNYTKNLKISGESDYSIPIQSSEPHIQNILQKKEYKQYGLRVITENPQTGEKQLLKIGETPTISYNWKDGESTGKPLKGTSAIKINPQNIHDSLEKIGPYFGGNVVLLGSISGRKGADDNEIIMSNAKVLATFNKDATWGSFKGDKMPPPKPKEGIPK